MQFIVSAAKGFREVYQSENALTSENNRFEDEVHTLRESISQTTLRLGALDRTRITVEQTQLKNVAVELNDAANDVLQRLEKLKPSTRISRLKVPLQWTRLRAEKSKIEKDVNRVQRCRQRLDTQMLVNLW